MTQKHLHHFHHHHSQAIDCRPALEQHHYHTFYCHHHVISDSPSLKSPSFAAFDNLSFSSLRLPKGRSVQNHPKPLSPFFPQQTVLQHRAESNKEVQKYRSSTEVHIVHFLVFFISSLNPQAWQDPVLVLYKWTLKAQHRSLSTNHIAVQDTVRILAAGQPRANLPNSGPIAHPLTWN